MGFNVHICTEKKGVEVGINVSFVHKKSGYEGINVFVVYRKV